MNLSPPTPESSPDGNDQLAETVAFVEGVARSAGEAVLQIRRESLDIVQKDDETSNIVTRGDLASEGLILAALSSQFPDDAVRGEEGASKTGGKRAWIIDPIDGTYNYAHGKPFSVSIGLVENNEPILGVLYFPDTNTTLSAIRGQGVRMNGTKIERRDQVALSQSRTGFDVSSGGDEKHEIAAYCNPLEAKTASIERVWCCTEATRRIVTGECDAYICGGGLTPFDLGAAVIIVREAGCVIEGLYDPIDFSRKKNPTVMATDRQLLEEIRTLVTRP